MTCTDDSAKYSRQTEISWFYCEEKWFSHQKATGFMNAVLTWCQKGHSSIQYVITMPINGYVFAKLEIVCLVGQFSVLYRLGI